MMKNLAHSLKGASGYVGASRLHYVCYFIQEHFVFNRFDKMLEYYPSLVEAAIEFKVYSRQIIAKYKSKCRNSILLKMIFVNQTKHMFQNLKMKRQITHQISKQLKTLYPSMFIVADWTNRYKIEFKRKKCSRKDLLGAMNSKSKFSKYQIKTQLMNRQETLKMTQ